MLLPLAVLALGAFFSGYAFYDYFVGDGRDTFWGNSLFVFAQNDTVAAAHHVPLMVKLLPIFIASAGILCAYLLYMFFKTVPARLATRFKPIYQLLLNKWYFDEIYQFLFVKPSALLARFLWLKGDKAVIDGLGPDGVSLIVKDGSSFLSKLQSGYVYHYAFSILMGIMLLMIWMLLSDGAFFAFFIWS
jgi:NADH-quinone oxidoreductase subunit L